MKKVILVLLSIFLLAPLAGCEKKSDKNKEEETMKAMMGFKERPKVEYQYFQGGTLDKKHKS